MDADLSSLALLFQCCELFAQTTFELPSRYLAGGSRE